MFFVGKDIFDAFGIYNSDGVNSTLSTKSDWAQSTPFPHHQSMELKSHLLIIRVVVYFCLFINYSVKRVFENIGIRIGVYSQ